MMTGLRNPRDTRGHAIDLDAVAGLLERIVRAWHPVGIWLFGSRARGGGGPASDWDLLIVVPDEVPGVDDPLTGWRLRRDSGVRCDLILARTSDFQEDRNTPNTLVFEAAHDGVLIYER